MSAILGWSQMLRTTEMEPDERLKGLEVIERNARVQTRIIEDLLDVSRIVSGKIRLDVQQVNLMEVIESAIATIRPAADAKGIRLQTMLDPRVAPVRGDASRLQQIVWNLVSNAIKFTDKGGRVQIALERVNSHVELTVSDTGQGIKPEFLPHLFERFRQADSSTTRRHAGLGLGLSIVKQLVELHGGSVRVKSPGEGKGSTFIVALPLMVLHGEETPESRPHPRLPTAPIPDEHQPSLKGLKLLVVDDEPDARDLVARILGHRGAMVTCAASAAEAITAFQTQTPDVLISDIGMPDEDGYELIRKIREIERTRGTHIQAVALTAFARSEDRTRAMLAGYQAHIAKPVEPAELIATVASVASVGNRPRQT
jgi:CheY-like chemotaxis protein